MDADNYRTQKRTKKRLCAECKEKYAIFSPKGGKYRADEDHDLCSKCWRSKLNQVRSMYTLASKTVRRQFHSNCKGIILIHSPFLIRNKKST